MCFCGEEGEVSTQQVDRLEDAGREAGRCGRDAAHAVEIMPLVTPYLNPLFLYARSLHLLSKSKGHNVLGHGSVTEH